MYTPEYFNDKRVIVDNLNYPELNGKRTILSHPQLNEVGHVIACTDIPHPEDKNAFLWINVNCEVTHILEYEGYTIQYINEKGQNVTVPYACTKDDIDKGFEQLGHFDVYLKIPISFTT